MNKPVLVFGDVSLDTNVNVYNLPAGADGIDVSYVTHGIMDHAGGSAANVALALNTLGVEVKLVGVLGKDLIGEIVRRRMPQLGIDPGYLFSDWLETGRSVNLVDPSGKRYILHDAKEAMDYKMPVQNYRHLLEPGAFAHFSVVNWTRFVIKEAKKRGVITCSDLHTGFDMEGYHKDYIENSVILFYSAQGLSDWKEAGLTLQSRGPEIVICMRAEEGCGVFRQGEFREYPACDFTDRIVDTVGAGDAMVGAYLACASRGMDFEDSLHRAQISGLFACTSRGTESCYINKAVLDEITARR